MCYPICIPLTYGCGNDGYQPRVGIWLPFCDKLVNLLLLMNMSKSGLHSKIPIQTFDCFKPFPNHYGLKNNVWLVQYTSIVYMHISTQHVPLCKCMHICVEHEYRIHAGVCMYVCMHACMSVCMYV